MDQGRDVLTGICPRNRGKTFLTFPSRVYIQPHELVELHKVHSKGRRQLRREEFQMKGDHPMPSVIALQRDMPNLYIQPY